MNKLYTFIGCCHGIETIKDYNSKEFFAIQLRCRFNPQREYYWGSIILHDYICNDLKQILSDDDNGPFTVLKLIMKGPYMLPRTHINEFRRNMLKAIKLKDIKKEIDEEIKEEMKVEDIINNFSKEELL